jgi:hypothetical protein
MKRLSVVLLSLLALTFSSTAQSPKPAAKKAATPAAPDKAYLQRILDNWATLDPANVAKFYASGPHTFFDITPLKYGSDVAIHPHGDLVWATATLKDEMTSKAGKVEMGNLRWTVVFENQDGKWLIVHEHFSTPLE